MSCILEVISGRSLAAGCLWRQLRRTNSPWKIAFLEMRDLQHALDLQRGQYRLQITQDNLMSCVLEVISEGLAVAGGLWKQLRRKYNALEKMILEMWDVQRALDLKRGQHRLQVMEDHLFSSVLKVISIGLTAAGGLWRQLRRKC